MFRALQYIILLVTIGMISFYVRLYQPEMINHLLINFDVFGFTTVARTEHLRVEKIRALSIPYEEKVVLMNRTVFMQASQEMVKLALGEPRRTIPDPDPALNKTYFVYYLADDKRPTVLVFVDDKLTNAYKGSALDNNIQDKK